MAKQKFKITNWPTYNKALINRGSITFWLDDEAIQAWYESATPSSRGRPQRYSDLAITTVLVIKRVFRLTLRAAQGFIDSIFSLMNVPLRCPDYSCVSRRAKSVNISFKTPTRGEIAHLVIDSTGLKVFGEGEWKVNNNQANIAIGAPDTLLDGGGIDYTEIGAIRWAFAIAPDHPLAFVPEPIAESQLRLYPNIMVEDTAHTINKKVGWLLHGQESILVPDFNTKCQCQILGEGIGFLPDYMVREAMAQSLLVTRQIHNPRQDSRMLLATQHSATGQVTQWIKKQFAPNGILTGIYQDLLHREN